MITELPKAFGESARSESARTEPPRTEPSRTDPAPAEAAPAEAAPAEAEAEERPVADEPAPQEERPRWDERPQWSDSSYREGLPQWPEPAQPVRNEPTVQAEAAPPREGAHRERQEWRPAEREIPPPPERRRRPAPIPVFTAPARPPVTGRPTADSLDPESLLRGRRNAPSKGWRRLVYKASGGWIKPGEAPEVRRRRELVTRARTPVTTGHHRVAVLSLKGGVGKTTTTVGLGATLAQMRGDRVIAVDANPDRGTLSDKLVLETSATVRDLLNERDQVKRYVDIRAFTSQAPSRLEVLASDRDPSVSEAFSGSDYQAVSQVLENFYSICLTDCGTGLLHSAMGGVLGLADQIVLVSSPSVDGARAASATLDWLEAHHYADLVRNATVVLCSVRPRSKSAVDIRKLEAHFAARCRAVIRVPYDPHLEEGAEIDLDRLQEPTREAYLQLAACVGDGFAGVRE
ncbi:MAG: MinD/ParA family protein [Nonomuraea sp.]|nr:MinD/ParA family protein [Nonomuraea sp.]